MFITLNLTVSFTNRDYQSQHWVHLGHGWIIIVKQKQYLADWTFKYLFFYHCQKHGEQLVLGTRAIAQFKRSQNAVVPYPRMQLFHIPQCPIQNRNVNISVLNEAFWDMEMLHSGICELGQLISVDNLSGGQGIKVVVKLQHYWIIMVLFISWTSPYLNINLYKKYHNSCTFESVGEIILIK